MNTITELAAAETRALVRVLRRAEVEAVTGLLRSTLYEKITSGDFPRPITISSRRVGWLAHEVTAWVHQRIAERDARSNVPAAPAETAVA